MAELVWDQVGERFYETGVDHGVLYIPDNNGVYNDGVAWNGLTSVSESPSGAEPNAQYADNIKYLNLFSAEEFGATIEAFTYPDEFAQFDGLGVPTPGVSVGQQNRRVFGLSYRTRLGNDVDGNDYGYKLHLIYGCQASPSEKAYSTINDSPEVITFSWEVSTTPVAVTGLKPTSVITIDSTKVDADSLAALEQILYGAPGVDPALPLPDTVITMFSGTVTTVTATEPAYDSATDTITIPTVAGVTYYIDGVAVPAGPVVITEDTVVEARANAGYVLQSGTDNDWAYDYTP
jgi:hypothetical protein